MWKQLICPAVDTWIRVCAVYTKQPCPATRRRGILRFATIGRDLEGIVPSG